MAKVHDLHLIAGKVGVTTAYWFHDWGRHLGLTASEVMRMIFFEEPEIGRRNPLRLRLPGPHLIGVEGTNGWFVGNLESLAAGRVSIDGPEADPTGHDAARGLPVVAHWSECERNESGAFTGRLSPRHRVRRPGRRASVQVARARSALALGETGGA